MSVTVYLALIEYDIMYVFFFFFADHIVKCTASTISRNSVVIGCMI